MTAAERSLAGSRGSLMTKSKSAMPEKEPNVTDGTDATVLTEPAETQGSAAAGEQAPPEASAVRAPEADAAPGVYRMVFACASGPQMSPPATVTPTATGQGRLKQTGRTRAAEP